MLNTFIDTHCHLDFSAYDDDREAVIESSLVLGVECIISPGVTAKRWKYLKVLAEQHPSVKVAYGLHPMFMDDHFPHHINQLPIWIEKESPIAIGECGLDFYIHEPNHENQIKLFEAHVQLAYDSRLPLIIHARKSLDIVLKIVKKYRGVRGVIHSFSGSEQQAKACLKLGFYLGLGGVMTYRRATRHHHLVKMLPLEAFLLETDAPDQPIEKRKGKRNEPRFLPEIAQAIASLRDCDIKEVAQCTYTNTKDLFGIGTITP